MIYSLIERDVLAQFDEQAAHTRKSLIEATELANTLLGAEYHSFISAHVIKTSGAIINVYTKHIDYETFMMLLGRATDNAIVLEFAFPALDEYNEILQLIYRYTEHIDIVFCVKLEGMPHDVMATYKVSS